LQFQEKILAEKKECHWSYGITAVRIKNALAKFCVDPLSFGYYRTTDTLDPDLDLIFKSIGVDIDLRIPTLHDLLQLKYSIDKAVL
jgi:hypothetical protein